MQQFFLLFTMLIIASEAFSTELQGSRISRNIERTSRFANRLTPPDPNRRMFRRLNFLTISTPPAYDVSSPNYEEPFLTRPSQSGFKPKPRESGFSRRSNRFSNRKRSRRKCLREKRQKSLGSPVGFQSLWSSGPDHLQGNCIDSRFPIRNPKQYLVVFYPFCIRPKKRRVGVLRKRKLLDLNRQCLRVLRSKMKRSASNTVSDVTVEENKKNDGDQGQEIKIPDSSVEKPLYVTEQSVKKFDDSEPVKKYMSNNLKRFADYFDTYDPYSYVSQPSVTLPSITFKYPYETKMDWKPYESPPKSDSKSYDSPPRSDSNLFDYPMKSDSKPYDSSASKDSNLFESPPRSDSSLFDYPMKSDSKPYESSASKDSSLFDSPPRSDSILFDYSMKSDSKPYESMPSKESSLFDSPPIGDPKPFDSPPRSDSNLFEYPKPFESSPKKDSNLFVPPPIIDSKPYESPLRTDSDPFELQPTDSNMFEFPLKSDPKPYDPTLKKDSDPFELSPSSNLFDYPKPYDTSLKKDSNLFVPPPISDPKPYESPLRTDSSNLFDWLPRSDTKLDKPKIFTDEVSDDENLKGYADESSRKGKGLQELKDMLQEVEAMLKGKSHKCGGGKRKFKDEEDGSGHECEKHNKTIYLKKKIDLVAIPLLTQISEDLGKMTKCMSKNASIDDLIKGHPKHDKADKHSSHLGGAAVGILLFFYNSRKEKEGAKDYKENYRCSADGTWRSSSLGIYLTMVTMPNMMLKVQISNDARSAINRKWSIQGLTMAKCGGPLLLAAVYPHGRKVASFIGQCKMCKDQDLIFGIWSVYTAMEKVPELWNTVETRLDVLRKFNHGKAAKAAKKMKKKMKKKKKIKEECPKANTKREISLGNSLKKSLGLHVGRRTKQCII